MLIKRFCHTHKIYINDICLEDKQRGEELTPKFYAHQPFLVTLGMKPESVIYQGSNLLPLLTVSLAQHLGPNGLFLMLDKRGAECDFDKKQWVLFRVLFENHFCHQVWLGAFCNCFREYHVGI